jgi:hypothetical protein
MTRYVYIPDPDALVRLLRRPEPEVCAVLPADRPWTAAARTALDRARIPSITDADTLEVPLPPEAGGGTLRIPARPPWTDFASSGPPEALARGGHSVIVAAGSLALKIVPRAAAAASRYADTAARSPLLMPVLAAAEGDDGALLLLQPRALGTARDDPDPKACLPPVAAALADLHEAGWVHLDVKPDNILIVPTPDGPRRLLADTGSARRAGETLGPAILCTPRYAAPEILRAASAGRPLRADPAMDVFSLALTALELLSGRHPLGPDPASAEREAVARALEGRPLDDAIPPGTHPALRAALDPDPTGRPTALELLEAILRMETNP